ncbi:hypothetical protein RMATCC62417_09077 [Rhizopus microsporus]|nr:hypothetical protein RMATCC62417_09077 [Rhizopus microsporus]
MPIININDNPTTRIIPEYDDEVATIRFVNEAEFGGWFTKPFLGQPLASPLRLHTIKYQCDHAEKSKKARTKESIKVGCLAYINRHLLTDGAVEVKYRWEHPDHNPCDVQEIILYRLPSEVKQWIEEHRAWETHIKRDVKISKSTQDTKLARDRVRANLNSMMYSEMPEAFDLAHQLFLAENKEFEVFLTYFNSLWLPRKELWSKAWRQNASFHINNLIESYHNQLKTFYLGRSRSLRVDRLVYLLSQVVALDSWQDTIKAAHDFGGFRLTASEEKKRAAYCIDYDVACSMVE